MRYYTGWVTSFSISYSIFPSKRYLLWIDISSFSIEALTEKWYVKSSLIAVFCFISWILKGPQHQIPLQDQIFHAVKWRKIPRCQFLLNTTKHLTVGEELVQGIIVTRKKTKSERTQWRISRGPIYASNYNHCLSHMCQFTCHICHIVMTRK